MRGKGETEEAAAKHKESALDDLENSQHIYRVRIGNKPEDITGRSLPEIRPGMRLMDPITISAEARNRHGIIQESPGEICGEPSYLMV